jgi:hypothetical protein
VLVLGAGAVFGFGFAGGCWCDCGICGPWQLFSSVSGYVGASSSMGASRIHKHKGATLPFLLSVHLTLHLPQLKRMFEDLRPAFPQLLRSRRRYGFVLQYCGTVVRRALPPGGFQSAVLILV